MKRRLRKKKRLGEFRELGFAIQAQLSAASKEARLSLIERFVNIVEQRTLVFGGGCSLEGVLEGFVMPRGRRSATSEDRAAVVRLFDNAPEIARFQVSDLQDVWYGWDAHPRKNESASGPTRPSASS